MGASLACMTFEDGDRNAIEKKWNAECDQSAYEDGNQYSGCIGMFKGMGIVWKDKAFPSATAAEDFLEEHHEKWEAPWAVSYFATLPPNEANKAKAQKLQAEGQALNVEAMKLATATIADLTKEPFLTCRDGCKSRINTKYLNGQFCPLCRKSIFGARAQKKIAKLTAKRDEKYKKAQELLQGKPSSKKRWLVGGWASE